MDLAPIVLSCKKRPWHGSRTLEAIAQKELASESVLYIYCEGPKPNASEEQRAVIEEVRREVRMREWCSEVYIIESVEHKGLANSVINGVPEVLNQYGKLIVFEDDLLTSPYFLTYMNESLDYSEDKKSVFSISAI